MPFRNDPLDDNLDDDILDDCSESAYQNLSGTDRKRRRGIIEKRRRDRINNSLADLRKLVPEAACKQNSSKLEKAEILQMTVEFLKRLHDESYVVTSESRAFENRRIGFQDCVGEVTRFLAAFDSIDPQFEELRRRLLSHLHSACEKRDMEAKARISNAAFLANFYRQEHQQILQQNSASNQYSTENYSHQDYSNYNGSNSTLYRETNYNSHSNITSKFLNTGLIYRNASVDSPSPPGESNRAGNNSTSSSTSSQILNNTCSINGLPSQNTGNNSPPLLSCSSLSGGPNESQSTTSPNVPSNLLLDDTELCGSSSIGGTPPNQNQISRTICGISSTAALQAIVNRVSNDPNSQSMEFSSPSKPAGKYSNSWQSMMWGADKLLFAKQVSPTYNEPHGELSSGTTSPHLHALYNINSDTSTEYSQYSNQYGTYSSAGTNYSDYYNLYASNADKSCSSVDNTG